MSIARIGEIKAKSDTVEALRQFLLSIVPIILSSDGCEACHLYQSQADPRMFIMVEVWQDVDKHQASVKNIPQELISQFRPLVADGPPGGYFDLLSGD